MAYIQQINKKKKEQGQSQGQTTQSGLAPTGGVDTGSQSSSSTGQFTNLNKYIGANQGQGSRLGSQLESKTQDQVESGGIDSLRSKAMDTIAKQGQSTEDLTGKLKSGDYGNVEEGAYQKGVSQKYEGPKSSRDIKGYNQASNVGRQLQDKSGLTQDFSGQKQLLKGEFARPTYGSGQANLDTFLLGQQGGESLQNIRDLSKQYGQDLGQLETDIGSQISSRQGEIANQVGGLQSAGQEALSREQTGFDTSRQGNQDTYTQELARMKAGDLSNTRGLDQGTAEFLKNQGYDLSKLMEGTRDGDFADKAHTDRLRAIQTILGQQTSGLPQGEAKQEFIDDRLMGLGSQTKDLTGKLSGLHEAQNQSRRSQFERAKSGTGEGVWGQGDVRRNVLSPEQLAQFSRVGGDLGRFNFGDFMRYGGDVGLGASIDPDQQAEFSQLQSLRDQLGLGRLETPGTVGNVVNWDKPAMDSALQAFFQNLDSGSPLEVQPINTTTTVSNTPGGYQGNPNNPFEGLQGNKNNINLDPDYMKGWEI